MPLTRGEIKEEIDLLIEDFASHAHVHRLEHVRLEDAGFPARARKHREHEAIWHDAEYKLRELASRA